MIVLTISMSLNDLQGRIAAMFSVTTDLTIIIHEHTSFLLVPEVNFNPIDLLIPTNPESNSTTISITIGGWDHVLISLFASVYLSLPERKAPHQICHHNYGDWEVLEIRFFFLWGGVCVFSTNPSFSAGN